MADWQRVPQYGVRYGDGEVEGPFTTAADARALRNSLRADIADGSAEAEDYEPMVIVERTWRVKMTKWRKAS